MNTTHPAGDENIDALLMTKKRTTVVLQSFDQKEYGIHDIRIYGTKRSVVLADYGITLIETPARSSRFVGVRQLDHSQGHTTHAPFSNTQGALAHVIECYEKRCTPSSSTTNGLATLRVLDAIARSAQHKSKKISVQ